MNYYRWYGCDCSSKIHLYLVLIDDHGLVSFVVLFFCGCGFRDVVDVVIIAFIMHRRQPLGDEYENTIGINTKKSGRGKDSLPKTPLKSE